MLKKGRQIIMVGTAMEIETGASYFPAASSRRGTVY